MIEQTKQQRHWALRYPSGDALAETAAREISTALGVSQILGRLLYARGYRDAASAAAFLRMEETQLHDPFLLTDMQKAVDRIHEAIEKKQCIAIYGDYDVDGVTSVSLLFLYLESKGARVGYYIPSRCKEGYGLSTGAIDRLHEKGVELMITVDTGITAIEETAYAKSLGIDVVVTDHHECREELPDVCAVVNPHRADNAYPFAELAGVGVVFKLVCAMEMAECRRKGESPVDGIRRICRTYADIAAIGTIADVMPVVNENRLIVAMGLRMIQKTERPGLAALVEAASGGKGESGRPAKKRRINSGFIGFGIAPRMNAAGRVSNASIAVELLLERERERAEELAEELCCLNVQRQTEENRIAEDAYRRIEETFDPANDRVIVLAADHWQQGIIGIVSSRITEKFGLPSILISFDGAVGESPSPSDVGKGSGRSVKGLNLVEALIDSEELLVRFGGHELAAGLSVTRENVDAFRRRINEYARRQLGDRPLTVTLDADCEVEVADLTMPLAKELETLEPFGVANPTPTFLLREVRILRTVAMGGGKHTKLTVEKDGAVLTAVWFGRSPAELPFDSGEPVDLLFHLNVNEFQNVTSLQLLVQDARVSPAYAEEYERARLRYEEIRGGSEIAPAEDAVPEREDMVAVYTMLRREHRAGCTTFSMRRLLAMLQGGERPMNYIKLKNILRIMQELCLCEVLEPSEDTYVFDFYTKTEKTSIERSGILHRLRSQLRRSGE